MSKYSGKCDFFDTIEIQEWDSIKNAKIYHNSIGPLAVKEKKDLIPVYPYIVGAMTSSKDGANERKTTIYLSNKSYVDTEEKERLEGIVREVRYWQGKAKRQKKEFSFKYLKDNASLVWMTGDRETLYKEVIDRIKSTPKGKEVDLYGLHDSIHTHYRLVQMREAKDNGMLTHPEIISVTHKLIEYRRLCKKHKVSNEQTEEIAEIEKSLYGKETD